MKLLAIRGRDLASLEGAFEIRLDAAPLRDAGVFAITGPTGAGKSTLLDAVCLALYDRTPRLAGNSTIKVGRDGEGEERLGDQDTRALLRRGAGEGSAEVDFVGTDGRRYRATWTARRANRKAGGRLQTVDVQFRDLDRGGEVLSRGTRTETLTDIESKVGLSFDQFRRSVLLAQGDFGAFLRASANDRAELLERMTGAEIYSRLSIAAFERAKRAKETFDGIQARMGDTRPLDDAERARLATERTAAEKDVKALAAEGKTLQAAVQWHRDREGLSKASDLAHAAAAQAEAAWVALGGTGGLADPAAHGAAEEALTALRALDEAVRRALENEMSARAASAKAAKAAMDAKASSDTATGRLTELDAAIAAAERWLEGEAAIGPIAADWPRLHHRLEALRAALADVGTADARGKDLAAAEKKLSAERARVARDLEDAQAAETKARAALEAARETLAKADVVGARARYEGSLHRRAALERLQVAGATADEATKHEAQERAAATTARRDADTHDAAAATAVAAEKVATIRLDEARAARERDLAVRDLAEHRAHLVEGKPCPLCGATAHPFAAAAPAFDEAIRGHGARIATLEAEQKKAATSAATETANGVAARKRATEADARAATAHTQRASALTQWNAARDEAGDAASSLTPDVLPAHAAAVDQATRARDVAQKLLTDAEKAQATADAHGKVVEQVAGTTGSARQVAADLDVRAAAIETDVRAVATGRAKSEAAARAAHDDIAGPLAPLPGWDRRVREDGDAFVADVAGRVKAFTDRTAKLASDRQSRESVERHAVQLSAQAAACDIEARAARDGYVAADTDRTARAEDRRRRFHGRPTGDVERTLGAARDAHRTAKERHADLAKHASTGAPSLPAAEAQSKLDAVESRRDTLQTTIGEMRAQLDADDKARKQLAKLQSDLDQARAQAKVWEDLSDLIGSADGRKLRTFAQGLTLDVLLEAANAHLADLRPRYRLERIPGANLDLQVVDRDLGDEVRSVASLSGGETFLVSLALALGLASLSGREVRVDTLFIDEGFGSLDPDALEGAIAVLDALQSEGRQVGIVSHVPGLAERLGARVSVDPVGVGRSRVSVS
jgi:exonuclease SbcC